MIADSFKDLGKRLTVTVIVIAIVGVLLFFSSHQIVRSVIIAILAALAGVGVWEYAQFVKAKEIRIKPSFLIFVSIVQVLAFWPHFGKPLLPLLVYFLFLLILFLMNFRHIEGSISALSVSAFGVLYVAIPLGMIVSILFRDHDQDGRMWLIYLLVVTKLSDIGAYFGGRIFGKRKMAPNLSPKKTIAGGFFGLVSAVVASYLFFYYSFSGLSLSLTSSIGLGVVLGVLALCGDLGESLFKRDAKIKDSNALPGLGGILDMLDSLLFNIPVVYLYLFF